MVGKCISLRIGGIKFANDGADWLVPEPSDGLLNKSVSSTRLRAWLNTRLRQLAMGQRVQDARALRSEFLVE